MGKRKWLVIVFNNKEKIVVDEITTQLLNNIKSHIENGGMVRKYLNDNNININIRDVRQAFNNEFGAGSFRSSMKKGMPQRFKNRIDSNKDNMFDTVEQCDVMLNSLNDIIEIINAKKIELGG
jgi:hypothetical protein